MACFSDDLRAHLQAARLDAVDPHGQPMTRRRLARICGVSERTIRRIELGHTMTVRSWLLDRWLTATGKRLVVTMGEL